MAAQRPFDQTHVAAESGRVSEWHKKHGEHHTVTGASQWLKQKGKLGSCAEPSWAADLVGNEDEL